MKYHLGQVKGDTAQPARLVYPVRDDVHLMQVAVFDPMYGYGLISDLAVTRGDIESSDGLLPVL